MSENKKGCFLMSNLQAELTKKYFKRLKQPTCCYILKLIKDSKIPNVTFDDCEDMYNEFFILATQTYDPSIAKFPFYLKKVVRFQTLSFLRRVIRSRDPLFYASSIDIVLNDGCVVQETIGDYDREQMNIDSIMSSPDLRTFNLSPLDKIILYYRGCGYKLEEIAKILNTSLSTVRRRIVEQRKNKKLLQTLAKFD